MKRLLGAIGATWLAVLATAHAAPPANDNFANATTITGNTGTSNGNTTEATVEPGEPNSVHGQSVWFTWVAPATGTHAFDTTGSNYDTFLFVYTGSALNALNLVGSDDDGGGSRTSLVTFPTTIGTVYRIRVAGFRGNSGNYLLNWAKELQPGNFTLGGPATVPETGGTATFTVTRTGGSDGAVTVNYATSSDTATSGADFQPASGTLSFAEGDTTKTFTVTITDDSSAEGLENFFLNLSNATGGAGISTSSRFVTIADNDRPPNDNFASADTITGASGTVAGTLNNSTSEVREPLNRVGNSIWYRWVAPSTGAAVFDTAGSAANTLLAAYTGGSVQNLTLLSQSALNPLDGDSAARLVFPVTQNATYYIQVVDEGGGGVTSLEWSISASGAFGFASSTAKVFEGVDSSLVLAVERIGGSLDAVTANYTIFPDSAEAPDDFTAASPTGTLSFAAGETVKTITIPIINDTVPEGDEDFSVLIDSVAGGSAVIGNRIAVTAGIIDDDDDPSFDAFARAQPLAGASVFGSFDSTGADLEPGEPDLGNGGGVVWFKWTAPETGFVRITMSAIEDVFQDEIPGVFSVFTGSSLATLVRSGAGGTDIEFSTVPVLKGVTYSIAATGQTFDPSAIQFGGSFTFGLEFTRGGSISASDLAVSETAGAATLVLNLDSAVGNAQAFVTFAGGSATNGLDFDFDPNGIFVDFAPGETQKTITVPLLNDFQIEGDETASFSVQTFGEVFADGFNVAVTIIDDDDDPANDLFANAQTFTGAAGTVDGTTIGAGLEAGEPGLQKGNDRTVWYRWTAPSSGLATFVFTPTEDATFHAYSGSTLASLVELGGATTFGGDQSSIQFAIAAGTTYRIAIGNLFGAQPDFSFTWSIDTTANLLALAAPGSVKENAGPVTITVTRSGNITAAATVAYATADDSATAPQDYASAAGILNFAAGESLKTFTVAPQNDTAIEGDESFTVTLSNPTGTGTVLGDAARVFVTIGDDDDDPANNAFANALVIAGAAGSQAGNNEGADNEAGEPIHGDDGGTSVWFSWTAPANGEVTFGVNDAPFFPLLAVYTGSTVTALNAVALGLDAAFIGAPSATFPVTAGTVYRIAVDGQGSDSGAFTLTWSLRVPGSLQFAATTFSQGEAGSAATITVTRTGGSAGPTSVEYATANGSAIAGVDYTATRGTLVFDSGETSKTFVVPIVSDAIFEQPETVLLALSNPTNLATISNPAATLTITDNDAFIPLKTSYSGLITGNALASPLTGGFTVTSDGRGGFSGTFLRGGKKVSFRGVFASDGTATVTLPGSPALTLKLNVTAGGDVLIGTLSDGTETAQVAADRNVFRSDVPATRYAGNYTLLLPGDRLAAATVPRGDGFATVNISAAGLAKIVGSLADGTAFTVGVQVSKNGDIPLFASLYKGRGSVSGALTLRSTPGISDGDGPVKWFKPVIAGDKTFAGGISVATDGLLSLHRFNRGERVLLQLEDTNGAAELSAGLAGLPPAGIAQVFHLSEGNAVSLPLQPAVSLKLKFTTATGAFSGTFQSAGGVATSFKGAFFRAQGAGSGYFLGTAAGAVQSGFVEIAPAD